MYLCFILSELGGLFGAEKCALKELISVGARLLLASLERSGIIRRFLCGTRHGVGWRHIDDQGIRHESRYPSAVRRNRSDLQLW